MTETQQSLGLDISVSHDTHQRRHEETDNTLDGIEPGYLVTEARSPQIITHACKVCTPNGELQEVHQCQTEFQIHISMVLIGLYSLNSISMQA